MDYKYELDLTTEDGRNKAKESIKESLINLKEEDKIFLSLLLYTLLETVSKQQVQIEELNDFKEGLNKTNLLK